MSNQWKEFESFAFEIQQKLSPAAAVVKNDTIRGKSGRLREVDISIRQKVGQFDLLMIIDCKNFKRLLILKQWIRLLVKCKTLVLIRGP